MLVSMKRAHLLAAALALCSLPLGAQMGSQPPAPMPMKPPVPPSKSLTVSFEGHTTVFTVEQLLKMPQVTVHVKNEHRGGIEETYIGPLLADVLAASGLKASRETQPLILHSSIIATGTDHYFVLYSAAEVEPMFSTGQVIVALMKGNMLPDDEGGVIQLINSTDARPARWVHGLANINVMSLSPTN
jgi:hypothetical protein